MLEFIDITGLVNRVDHLGMYSNLMNNLFPAYWCQQPNDTECDCTNFDPNFITCGIFERMDGIICTMRKTAGTNESCYVCRYS